MPRTRALLYRDAVDAQEIERRFQGALARAGLLKTAEGVAPQFGMAGADEAHPGTTIVEQTTETVDEEPDVDAPVLPPPTAINLFQHPDAHPYVLDLALLRKYGPEWLEWERETLELQVPQDFPTPHISDLNMTKLQGIKTLHLVDTFWQDWEVFVPVTMAMNGMFPDFKVMQVPTVAECAVALDIAERVRGELKWSDEMLAYLEVVHRHDGIACAIPPLSFVEVDSEDYPVDCEEVKQRWPEVRKSRKAPTEDSAVAEQLRRLLIVQEALDESRQHLAAQLPILLMND